MGPKKKSSKKERARLTAELIEKMRIEQEQEAARLMEIERQRLEKERLEALEKDKKATAEQLIREEQLNKSVTTIEDIIQFNKDLKMLEREKTEWELYVNCGKLPNPSKYDQMNTYLHLWNKFIDHTTIDTASVRTKDVIKLLSDLDDLIDTIVPEEQHKIYNWKWIRQMFRDNQAHSLNIATYRLLRTIAKNLNPLDIQSADFNFNDEYINLSIWLRVQLPIPVHNPRRPPKPRLEVTFSNLNMQVLFPTTINCEGMAIRAIYLKYDHLSDRCTTFKTPEVPQQLLNNLYKATRREWRAQLKYKYDNRDKNETEVNPQQIKTMENITDDDYDDEDEDEPVIETVEVISEFDSDEEIPTTPYKKLQPNPFDFVMDTEESFYSEIRKKCLLHLPSDVINLRKYSILGGIYHLDLLYQPPQPQNFVTLDMNITSLYIPKQLEPVPYKLTYIPPDPPEPGVRRLPEEIEEEMKKQEQEMDKLMLITVSWPQHVIFLELPIVCQWDEEEKHWSKTQVHDLKHNEEKGVLTFRTGIFGTFGLAAIRYANLPFQAWEVKPEANGSVMVQITAAILMLEFNVKDGLTSLTQLQNSPNNTLQDIIGVYMKLHKLKRIMKEAGVDVFPEYDAFCYIENSCEKHWPMEKHLYYDMSRLSNCFNFAWSRWNLSAGRRKIVVQIREFFTNKSKQKTHSMLLITPLKASFIECTEVSQTFCDNDAENMKFSADLFNLIRLTFSVATRKRIQGSKETIFNLAQLLIAIRPLSFS